MAVKIEIKFFWVLMQCNVGILSQRRRTWPRHFAFNFYVFFSL